MIWCLLIVVGASSAYFHATLSLLGQVQTSLVIYLYLGEIMQLKHAQLLDELAILWVVMACYWLWYPEFALPPPYR